MLISEELAQRIVDTAQRLIHRNVNIMNRDGVIIGTAQPHRRRDSHRGAQEVMETGAAVEIFEDELALYPGALPGVNLPIVLDGQTVGVVGLTGPPGEVRQPARLIKVITELILERELLQQEARIRVQRTDRFLDELLRRNTPDNRGRIRRFAAALRLDPDLPRAVVLADLTPLRAALAEGYGRSDLVQERASDKVLGLLSDHAVLTDRDAAAVLDDRLVILKAAPPDPGPDGAWARALIRALEGLEGGVPACGVGAAAQGVEEYPASHRQAEYCLSWSAAERPLRGIHEPEVCSAFVLGEAARGAGAMALRPLAALLDLAAQRKPGLKRTLQAVLSGDGDLDAAADALGVHRNTVAYRLQRLRQATGLDPLRRLDHAVLLKALLGRPD